MLPIATLSPTLEPVSGIGLPVFREDTESYVLFYAPGCVVVSAPDRANSIVQSIAGTAPPQPWSIKLGQHARQAAQTMAWLRDGPFTPECLTIYLHSACNLRCVYCYARPSLQDERPIDVRAVAAAGEIVARNCHDKKLPFTVVLHGGGEPTLQLHLLESILATVHVLAQRYSIEPFVYIATNGIMSRQKARWLASQVDMMGLSCDGPPIIQNSQRPRYGARNSSHALEATADVLHEVGQPFRVRATITTATLDRQAEIADYICSRLRPVSMAFEPVYVGGHHTEHFVVGEAWRFVVHFIEAQHQAAKYGVSLSASGSRPGDIHGPFCNVFRQTLNLVPPGAATACFKVTTASQNDSLLIGELRSDAGFVIEQGRVEALRETLSQQPKHCVACFNRYHCAGGCPDSCPLYSVEEPGFRCHVQRLLAYHRIRTIADRLWIDGDDAEGIYGTIDL